MRLSRLDNQMAIWGGARICLLALMVVFFPSSEVNAAPSQLTLAESQVTNPCATAANPRNPCAAKNPCAATAANPCNPCAAKNPCATAAPIDPALITRPADTKNFTGSPDQLVKEGERLWHDQSLGTSGLACQTCHRNHANFNPSFAKPYPHTVAMPKQRAGVEQIHLDEMVQFCMVVPMASQPLRWDSQQLAALTAYTAHIQKGFIQASATNPCNPCASKNPCTMKTVNPCAAQNPCSRR